MAEETLKVSDEYLKAYNHADMLCTYMPHIVETMELPQHETSEYSKGFRDRVRQFEIERDAMRNFSVEQLREKYGKDLDAYGKNRDLDITKD